MLHKVKETHLKLCCVLRNEVVMDGLVDWI